MNSTIEETSWYQNQLEGYRAYIESQRPVLTEFDRLCLEDNRIAKIWAVLPEDLAQTFPTNFAKGWMKRFWMNLDDDERTWMQSGSTTYQFAKLEPWQRETLTRFLAALDKVKKENNN